MKETEKIIVRGIPHGIERENKIILSLFFLRNTPFSQKVSYASCGDH